jgi:uncharacterized DUF497 family protein
MRYQLSVQFEFDQWKSENNKTKHGIDFVQAQTLWKSTRAEIDTYEKVTG